MTMTIYTGLCVGGPRDGELLAHDGTVYRMPIQPPLVADIVGASLRFRPVDVKEFVYVRSVARLGSADLPIWKPVDQSDDETIATLCAGYGRSRSASR